MSGSSATIVAGLTAAALATVGLLALQAAATVPPELAEPRADAAVAARKVPRARTGSTALPSSSGAGERVVYALDEDRVWLVGPSGRVERTFPVSPGTVDPAPGAYAVTSRSSAATGTDGAPVEHVVRFTHVGDVVIGFSSTLDGSAPVPDPEVQTGGIREGRADGEAMWRFATIGQRIVVVR
ncbi:hypothetical protein [Streptomyces sp. NPDC002328]|uniref:hypothetical protein n=1 Tax=Streptomyces sp. NPDC002328 TaxID=3364642 RepID=UPI0036B65546